MKQSKKVGDGLILQNDKGKFWRVITEVMLCDFLELTMNIQKALQL